MNTGSGNKWIIPINRDIYITLTVTNTSGHSASQTSSVTIFLTCTNNIQITICASGDSWESIDFAVTADDESGGSLNYSWDFGDGNTDSGTSVSHTYRSLWYL